MNGELYINGRLIDINEALPFPFTYNISDIKDLSTRKGNKSKTITLPGTANNCALMASIYLTTRTEKIITSIESEFLNFDPTVKSLCQYYSNGLLVFNGIAQLLECKLNNGSWSFEISMVSSQIDYIALMKKIKINELNFNEYDHICNIANQLETWSGNNQINGVSTTIKSGADWLGIGYYYGLIDYGYTRVAPDTFRVDQLAPQVFVYEILKKLFEAVELTWQSTFFETQRFKRLLLAFFGGTLPDIDAAEAAYQSVTSNENNNSGGFIMQQTSITSLVPDGSGYSYQIYSNPTTMVDIVDCAILTDPNVQTITTTPFKFKAKTSGIFNIEYNGNHNINLTQTVATQSFLSAFQGFFIVKKNNVVISTNQLYANTTGTNYVFVYNNTIAFGIVQSINLLVNDELTFEVQFTYSLTNFPNNNNVVNSVTSTITSNSVNLNIKKQIQTFNSGDTIRINQFLPDMTGDVFFKAIITAFNLYLRPKNSDPTIIEIEPLNEFYNDSNAALDWTYFVDRSKEIKVTPTTNLAANNYNFLFENDNDYWNKKFFNDYKEQYGSFLFDTQNQYATNNTDLKIPFAQKPLVVIPTTSLIVPRSYEVNFDESATGQVVPMKGKSFIVQLGEMRSGTWKHRSGSNVNTTRTTYPYVGHLDDIDVPTFDFNFGVPDFVFYSASIYTANNLYSYHETFIKEIVSRYGKLVTLNVMLNSSIINQLDFKNLILIDGVVYRLQSIKDFDPGKQQSTQIELIRILQGDSAEEISYRITEAGDIREIEENTNLRIIE